MNNVKPIFHSFLLVVFVVFLAGCASTANNSPVGSPIEPSPGVDPSPGIVEPGGTGVDRAETVSVDLANTVDKVKDRNKFLPQRGVFFSVGVQELERSAEASNERTGSDSDISNISIGYDQILADSWVVGTLFDWSKTENVFDEQDDFSMSSKSLSVFLFASLAVNDVFDVSAYAGLSETDTSSERFAQMDTVFIEDSAGDIVDQIAISPGSVQGNADGDVISAGVTIARRYDLGAGTQFILSADADIFRVSTDDFTEQGSTNSELAFRENTRENLKWTLGGGISRSFSRSAGVFVPAITLAYIHEDQDDEAIVADVISVPGESVTFDTAANDSNFGKVDFDIVWVRPGGLQLFANLNTKFKDRFEKSIGANVGARLEF